MVMRIYQEGQYVLVTQGGGSHWPVFSVCHTLNHSPVGRSPAELGSVLCSWPMYCLHCSRQQQMPKLNYTHLPPALMEQSKPQTCLDISNFPTFSLCLVGYLYEQETGHKYARQGSPAQMSSNETLILG